MTEAKIELMRRRIQQKRAAELIKVSPQFLSQCILGQRKLPIRHARKLARRFGVPIESWYQSAKAA